MVMMLALQVFATQGGTFGWTSPITLGLLVAGVIFAVLFVRIELKNPFAFVDFGLFRHMT